MENLKIRYLVVVILLSLTAFLVSGLGYDSNYDEKAGLVDLQAIPMQIGGEWQGQDFPLEEKVYKILETRAIIHRSYKNKHGDRVFLSLVHYHDAKVDFHAPEACIGGRGIKTVKVIRKIVLYSESQKISVDVAEMVTTQESGQTLTYYFFKAGNYIGSNYIKMRLSLAANKLSSHNTSASLVRISTVLLPDKKALSASRLQSFMADLLPFVRKSL